MKRFGSVVLVLAVIVSIGVHFLLFRILVFEEETAGSEPKKYEVTLKYKSRLPTPQKEQQKRQPKKRQVEKKPLEKEEEPPKKEKETLVQEQEEETEEKADYPNEIEGGQVLDEETVLQPDTGSDYEERGQQYERAVSELRERIIRKKVYPQAARRRNIEGVVLIFLELDAGGEPVDLHIIQSSGSRILDKAALSLIEKVIPFEHELEMGLSVKIPIRYDLEE
jgi:protein TonB